MKIDSVILNRLQKIKGFVFDMDGTLVLGDKRNNGLNPLPGAVEFLHRLRDDNVPYVVMTNGTLRTPAEYVPELTGLGFPVHESIMMTPSSVAADYFVRRGFKRIMVLGCKGVWQPLADAGLDIVLSSEGEPGAVDAVYIGWYREFSFHDLEAACNAVWQGAKLFSASNAPFFATASGKGIGTSLRHRRHDEGHHRQERKGAWQTLHGGPAQRGKIPGYSINGDGRGRRRSGPGSPHGPPRRGDGHLCPDGHRRQRSFRGPAQRAASPSEPARDKGVIGDI